MSDKHQTPKNNTGSLFIYPFVVLGGIIGALTAVTDGFTALVTTLGYTASVILIGIGIIGWFVNQRGMSLQDGVQYSLIWTFFILASALGYFVIISRPVTVAGVLVNNSVDRQPVDGYPVQLYTYRDGDTAETSTNPQGIFEFEEVVRGEYDLIINGTIVRSEDVPTGLWARLAGQYRIESGRFYLDNLGRTVANNSTPTIVPSDTSIPTTATDTATQTPIPPTVTNVPTSTRRPTNTPRPPTVTATAIFTGGLFDDFQSVEFEGSYDSRRWIKSEGNPSDTISQSEGVLNLVASNRSGFFLNPKVTLTNNSTIAVSMRLSDRTDRRSNITINTWFQDINSWIEFGVYSDDSGRPTILIIQAGEILYATNAAFDRWYDIKIEYDMSEQSYRYFVDDQNVLEYTVTSNRIPNVSIQLWKDATSDIAAAAIDNVIIDF